MSDSWFPPVDDGSFTFSPWNTNPPNPQNPNPDQFNQPFSPSHPYPPPPPSSFSPHLPFPGSDAPVDTRPRYHSTNHLYPSQHSTPSASLHAALREGIDFLPRSSNLPHLPPLSRFNSTPAQHSAFGYIPNHFFYSPPQSPQDPDPQQHTTNAQPAQPSAASSSIHPFAGPSDTKPITELPAVSDSAQPQAAYHSRGPSGHTYSANFSTIEQPQYPDPFAEPPFQQINPTAMPSASASTSNANASRKRSRPSFSSTPPPATKRRLNHPIQLDDSDGEDDEIEELGPDNDILAKEREALVNKQREESSKVNRIGELNCMICLEHFTNMTATHCGHIFCHECLTQALIASQRNSDHNYGTCPACRKPIKPKGKNQIVPLALKKGKKK